MKRAIIAESGYDKNRTRLCIVLEVLSDERSFDALKAIRDASAEFCGTEPGAAVLKRNDGRFDYGDFAECVPQCICRRHGFTIQNTFPTSIVVNQDENIVED